MEGPLRKQFLSNLHLAVYLLIAIIGINTVAFCQGLPGMPPGLGPQPVNRGYATPVEQKGQLITKVTQAALKQALSNAQKTMKVKKPSVAAVRSELAKLFGLRTSVSITNNTVLLKGSFANQSRIQAAINKGLAERAEPNFKVRAFQAAPDDTFYKFGLLWGLNNSGTTGGVKDVDIDAPEAWQITEGSASVVVAVVDTGVSQVHLDLKSRLWENPREVPNNNLDDDNNGYIDDVRGWDFIGNDNIPGDPNMHGTHVAGTIAAQKGNARGVVGVAPGVKIISLRVLNAKGEGDSAGVMKAIQYAISLKKAGVNLRVINLSLGGGDSSDSFKDLLLEANQAGILVVAAAGNETNNNDSKPTYPASYDLPNVISVAAVDNKGELASFSNFGAKSVDLAAPGVFIWSAVPFGFYFFLDGTSMAAPHVSGVAALLYSRNSNLTPAQVISVMKESVKRIPSLEGKMAAPGIISAYRALASSNI
jgi:subtilisin family serine protease